MRYFLALLTFLAAFHVSRAQTTNTGLPYVQTTVATGAPSGSCASINAGFVYFQVDATNGRLWVCDNSSGSWAWDHLSTTTYYTSAGAVTGIKCWLGNTTSATTTGAWSVSYAGPAFSTIQSVQMTPLSTGSTATTMYSATLNSVSTTAASGYVFSGATLTILGATIIPVPISTTVYVTVCGQ